MGKSKECRIRVNPVCTHPAELRETLRGEWLFRLDPEDRGAIEDWQTHPELFAEPIHVPGCWQGQGIGHDGMEEIRDFGLSARVYRATSADTGWYLRRFSIPAEWRDKRVRLAFGGVHPTATVWLNGVLLGENHLPFAPFAFDIDDALRTDGENTLVVRVSEDDRIYGMAYNWQGNWSGVYRGVELTATEATRLESLDILADAVDGALTIRAAVDGPLPEDAAFRITLSPWNREGRAQTWTTDAARTTEATFPVEAPDLWSMDEPHLYRVDVELRSGDRILDARSERTGFVDLRQRDRLFRVNGEPVWIRGCGEFTPWPETGSPDTDRDRWRRKLATLRAYGYNQVRCQSYAPPPEYLDAADEVGLLVQSEMGMLGAWGGHTKEHVYAWPPPGPLHAEPLREQWNAVVRRDLHHPSANMYCMSNELYSGTLYPRTARRCAEETKAIKPTALLMWTDGGFAAGLPQDVINHDSGSFVRNGTTPERPLIEHEFRWWSSYPDVRIMEKYDGAVRPYAAELALRAAAKRGLTRILPEAAANSQRLWHIEAKGKLEELRRNRGGVIAGVSHFNAVDTNPSPQGVLDEFFEPKATTAEDWLRVNGDAVVLCDLRFDDRCLASGDARTVRFFVSDYARPSLSEPRIEWRLLLDGETVANAETTWPHEPHKTVPAGEASFDAPAVETPARALLRVELRDGDRRIDNEWDLWIFPKQAPLPEGVVRVGPARHTWLERRGDIPAATAPDLSGAEAPRLVLTETLSPETIRFMGDGGRVFLCASEGVVRPMNPKLGLTTGRYFFTPPANYGPYEDGLDGTIVRDHPMLGDFPHEGFADLQMYRLVAESPPVELEAFDLAEGDPVVRALHSYSICRPLGWLVERRVGRGGIVVSSLDLDPAHPEATWMLRCICRYAVSDRFAPESEMDEGALDRLAAATRLP